MKVLLEIEIDVEEWITPKDLSAWVDEMSVDLVAPGLISYEVTNYDWFPRDAERGVAL